MRTDVIDDEQRAAEEPAVAHVHARACPAPGGGLGHPHRNAQFAGGNRGEQRCLLLRRTGHRDGERRQYHCAEKR